MFNSSAASCFVYLLLNETGSIAIFVFWVNLNIYTDLKQEESMNRAFLSLGGNLGNRTENLNTALSLIKSRGGKIIKTSLTYETEAWGSSSQKKYLNRVIELETPLKAEKLIKETLKIEKELGRKRSGNRNADRAIDIDLLFFNDNVISSPQLQVPHPRLHLRKFVLIPLCDIDKKLVHPVLKKTAAALLKECNDTLEVISYPAKPHYICIEGNIGSGKTTLAKALVKKFGAVYLPELVEGNAMLPLFYADPKLYAFPVEYSFLISRFQQLVECFKQPEAMVVSDFSFYKCLWFARVNLPGKEYRLFKKHFDALLAQLPEPDLLVYLETGMKNLKQNIKKRGRGYEQKIAGKYLSAVDQAYRKGLQQLSIPRLSISINRYHPALERQSIKTIEKYLKENFG